VSPVIRLEVDLLHVREIQNAILALSVGCREAREMLSDDNPEGAAERLERALAEAEVILCNLTD